jgi:hypothetical protein
MYRRCGPGRHMRLSQAAAPGQTAALPDVRRRVRQPRAKTRSLPFLVACERPVSKRRNTRPSIGQLALQGRANQREYDSPTSLYECLSCSKAKSAAANFSDCTGSLANAIFRRSSAYRDRYQRLIILAV